MSEHFDNEFSEIDDNIKSLFIACNLLSNRSERISILNDLRQYVDRFYQLYEQQVIFDSQGARLSFNGPSSGFFAIIETAKLCMITGNEEIAQHLIDNDKALENKGKSIFQLRNNCVFYDDDDLNFSTFFEWNGRPSEAAKDCYVRFFLKLPHGAHIFKNTLSRLYDSEDFDSEYSIDHLEASINLLVSMVLYCEDDFWKNLSDYFKTSISQKILRIHNTNNILIDNFKSYQDTNGLNLAHHFDKRLITIVDVVMDCDDIFKSFDQGILVPEIYNILRAKGDYGLVARIIEKHGVYNSGDNRFSKIQIVKIIDALPPIEHILQDDSRIIINKISEAIVDNH